jgi:hypothetical protein
MGSRGARLEPYRAAAQRGAIARRGRCAPPRPTLRRAPDAKRAEAYRLSLEGWRHLEHNDVPAAAASLDESLALNGSDPVARYRLGRVQQARKEDAAALAHYRAGDQAARTCPPPILGYAYVDAARILERQANARSDLVFYNRIASSLFGAAADTRAAAQRDALDHEAESSSDRMRFTPPRASTLHPRRSPSSIAIDRHDYSQRAAIRDNGRAFFDISCTLCLTVDFSHP